MDDNFLGQIMLVAGTFAPKGYIECDGRLLNIAQNAALFSLILDTYGGDGKTTFAIPDLRGRIVCGAGERERQGRKPVSIGLGERVGTEKNMVSPANMPSHKHRATVNVTLNVCSADDQDSDSPIECYLRPQAENTYSYTHDATMGKVQATVNLENQNNNQVAMNNIMPSLPMIYCICIDGRYPDPD